MSIASVAEFQTVVRSYKGRYSIGTSSSDAFSTSEIEAYLNDAEAEIYSEYNTDSTIFALVSDSQKRLFKRLQCMYVLRYIKAIVFSTQEQITMIENEIKTIKKALSDKTKISIVDLSETSKFQDSSIQENDMVNYEDIDI